MPKPRRWVAFAGAVLALVTLSGCEALRDTEPWDATVTYTEDESGKVIATPLTINADAPFGQVQVINETTKEHGFAVTDHNAAIFGKIPRGKTRIIGVDELKDKKIYRFYCNLHDEDADGAEFYGQIIVKYLAEEFR